MTEERRPVGLLYTNTKTETKQKQPLPINVSVYIDVRETCPFVRKHDATVMEFSQDVSALLHMADRHTVRW